jgi:hypothetical protein
MPFVKMDKVDPMQMGEGTPVDVPIRVPGIDGMTEGYEFKRTLSEVMDNGALSARAPRGSSQILSENDMRNHARPYRTNPAKVKA